MLDEMTWRNASIFAIIFYINENPKLLFLFFDNLRDKNAQKYIENCRGNADNGMFLSPKKNKKKHLQR